MHRSGFVADAIVGAITIVLAAVVAMALLRALRRQRELVTAHLKELDEKNRELAAFASRVAHDLRGPLNPLRGYSDLLQLHGDEEVRESARRIGRAVERMSGMIEDMLGLSVEGKPRPGSVAVAPVVREVLDELGDQLAGAEVTMDLGDVVTACSAGVLGQVLANVVGNAAKYRAPERKLALRVVARRSNGAVEITVSDNGIGMDAETVAHAFEPLYRAPGASSPGHGLGLSIVQRTLSAVGGSVDLASTRGQGTRVTLRVPAA